MSNKILQVKGNYEQTGGPETILTALIPHLNELGIISIPVILDKKSVEKSNTLFGRDAAVQWCHLPWRGLAGSIFSGRDLAKLYRAKGADIIHTHDMRSNLAAFWAGFFTKTTWVAHIHGWLGETHSLRFRIYEKIDKFLIRYANHVLVGSNATQKEVLACGVSSVSVVANSVEIIPACTKLNEAQIIRHSLNIGDDEIVVGVLGRVHPGKGQCYFVKAMAKLVNADLPVRGLIVGSGQDLDRVKQEIIKQHMENSILAVGFMPDSTSSMQAMDIIAIPSLKESLPLTALEAMMLQKPVIASEVGDLPIVIKHRRNGLLVIPGSVDSLADAIKSLVLDSGLARKLAENGRRCVKDNYSAATMAQKIKQTYQHLTTL